MTQFEANMAWIIMGLLYLWCMVMFIWCRHQQQTNRKLQEIINQHETELTNLRKITFAWAIKLTVKNNDLEDYLTRQMGKPKGEGS